MCERVRARERVCEIEKKRMSVCMFVSLCVRESFCEIEKERMSVCMFVRERE